MFELRRKQQGGSEPDEPDHCDCGHRPGVSAVPNGDGDGSRRRSRTGGSLLLLVLVEDGFMDSDGAVLVEAERRQRAVVDRAVDGRWVKAELEGDLLHAEPLAFLRVCSHKPTLSQEHVSISRGRETIGGGWNVCRSTKHDSALTSATSSSSTRARASSSAQAQTTRGSPQAARAGRPRSATTWRGCVGCPRSPPACAG
jgi:hypothetical protein